MANISQIKLPNGDIFDLVDDSKSTATNWINGSQTSSVRTIGSTAEDSNYTIGIFAITEGRNTKASGYAAHAEGEGTTASGDYSHVEGYYTTASQSYSHAEGYSTTASGRYSHTEGQNTTASNYNAHAEGQDTIASGSSSHAEGNNTVAGGYVSHAEGSSTEALGDYSHAEGSHTVASGYAAHADGSNAIANHAYQHVFGEYNIEDTSTAVATERGNYVEIVGNGTAYNKRSNARTLDWSGNEVLAGKLTVGAVGVNSMDVATVGQIPNVPSWAMASTKPTYTASEVGALPSTTLIPTKTSDLTNDGDGTSAFATMDDIDGLGSGTITQVKTTAGTHTTIDVSSGVVSFNIPTKTSHLTNDSGFVTTDNKVLQSASTSTAWRKVLLHYTTNSSGGAVSTATNQVYAAIDVEVQPSTGTLAVGALTSAGIVIGDSFLMPGYDGDSAGFRMTSGSGGDNERDNMDMGWDWTSIAGAGAAFRSSKTGRTNAGQFVFFARTKDENENAVYTQLVGNPGATNNGGTLLWGGRRVVTATEATAVGSASLPVYVDADGHIQPVTAKSTANALIDSIDTATANWTDNTLIVTSDATGDTNLYYRRPATYAWNYIKGKADTNYLKLTGGSVTGPTTFGDTVSIDDLNAGQLVVSGSASVANNLQVNTINGVTVGSNPKFTDNNTTYSAGTGLSLSSTTFSLATSGATAGSYGPSANASPSHGGTFSVPYVTVDTYGRVTAVSTKTITLPADSNTDTKVKFTANTPASEITAYPLFYTSTASTAEVYTNAYTRFWIKEGTTSADGYSYLGLGNATASGTAANSKGYLRLYGSTAYYNQIYGGAPGANYTQTLPTNGSGTLLNTVGNQQINNIITLYREGTTANNYPAGLKFKVKDTTTGQTYDSGYLYAYQDHGSTTYGVNFVLSGGGGLFIGSGESPANHYSAKGATYSGEDTFITADGTVFIQGNGNTIANRLGFYVNTSHQVIPCKADAATNNVGSLGTSSYHWANLYVTNINGTAVPAITAATAGTSSATSGNTLAVPYVTYNAKGMITAAGTHTHTIFTYGTSDLTAGSSALTTGTLYFVYV